MQATNPTKTIRHATLLCALGRVCKHGAQPSWLWGQQASCLPAQQAGRLLAPQAGSLCSFARPVYKHALAAILAASMTVTAAELGPSSKLPKDAVEVVGVLGTNNSLVELKDGTLLANNGRLSKDGGQTWSSPRSFGKGIAGAGLTRLKSGALALVSQVGYAGGKMWLSQDEGKTWELAGPIKVPGGPVYELGDTMIQLTSGRLLYCWDYNMVGEHADVNRASGMAYGVWKGKRYAVESHGHMPEFYASGFSWSDDEGKTWTIGTAREMPNVLMGWFDSKGEPNGLGGISVCGEASMAETRDGRVLLFGRSTVGRMVQSVSKDGGQAWAALRPTVLASGVSPPRLRRIPKTGDLLCIWNQMSAEEIRRGFRRGRLSAAISKDGGATWGNFKTIEVSGGLEDVSRIEPEPEVRDVRARQDVGKLPDSYAFYHYANVNFAGDKVYVMYSRGGAEAGNAELLVNNQQVLRIYPLAWFYQ